jgi:hypothetical protein
MLPLPPPLFKYAKQEHADMLVQKGRLRIGTLHDYRRIEIHGPMIGDDQEGWAASYDAPAFATPDTLSPFAAPMAAQTFRSLFGTERVDTRTVGFINCMFSRPRVSPNCWLYCTSARLGRRVMESMEKGYDACVRIDYVDEFFKALAEELDRQRLITGGRIIRCVYRDREQHYTVDDRLASLAIKSMDYAIQEEVRFVYFPANPITEEYRDVTIPELTKLVEAVTDIPE